MNLEEEILTLLKEVTGSVRIELELIKKIKAEHETRLVLLESKKSFWNETTVKFFIYVVILILAILGIKIKL